MTRLDRQIATVRSRLIIGAFLRAWARGLLLLGVAVWLAVIGEKILDRAVPHQLKIFYIGIAITAAAALIWSLARRPTAKTAAVTIDLALGLKEKYSTALYARRMADPFAHAVVLDAETTAQNVSIARRFPIPFPRQAAWAAAVFAAAWLTSLFLPAFHLFPKPPDPKPAIARAPDHSAQDKLLKDQLPRIEQATKLLTADDAIRRASAELDKAAHSDEPDQLHAKRSALAALQDYQKALKEAIDKNQELQTSQDTQQALSQMDPSPDESTPMGKAQDEMKAGDIDAAMKDVAKAVDDFDKMKPADQDKVIQQAQQLAQQLAKASNDPRTTQRIAQQLMQMGASQQQAQQMAQAMQQAAQGNPQAAQQLQQMAKQMAQQMNGGQGPTQQQQKSIQQMMAKAQGLANSQAQAQALSGSATKLAQAMAQSKAGQQGQSGQSGQPQQGNQGQGQQGQSGQGNNQGLAQAGQGMQQQLQQMQAQAQDAQAMKAAADAAAQAAADAANGINGNQGSNGNNPGNNGNQGNGQGQFATGQQGNGGGAGGPGKGGGKSPDMVATPFHMQQELDPSQDNGTGKMLASRFVKAGIDPGKSTEGLHDVAVAAQQDAPDEIDQDHISREAQQSVKDYFSGMQQDSP
jgi:hypothetical protein